MGIVFPTLTLFQSTRLQSPGSMTALRYFLTRFNVSSIVQLSWPSVVPCRWHVQVLPPLWLGDPCPLQVAFLAWFFFVGPALIMQALPIMFLPSPARRTWRPSLRGGARGRGRGRGSVSRGRTASSRGRGFYEPEPQPVECHTAVGGNAEDLLRWFKLHAANVFHYPSFVQQGPADSDKGVYYLQFREERERSRFLDEFGSFEEHWLSAPVVYPELRKPAAAAGSHKSAQTLPLQR